MKVWNVTDDPRTKHASQPLVLFGKKVAPGKAVSIPDALWKGALKSQKDVDRDMLFAGDKLPNAYLAATGRLKAKLPAGGIRTHGILPSVMATKGPAMKAAPKKTMDSKVSVTVEDDFGFEKSSKSSKKSKKSSGE